MKFSFKNLDKTFIIAELSGNHLQDIKRAKELIKKASEAGADAIKIQTFTPDTISLNPKGIKKDIKEKFHTVKIGHPDWKGVNYNELYNKVYTPWEWHKELDKYTKEFGMILFSTPFDFSSVDYLEEQNVPIYKIASYDLINLPLTKKIAQTKKPTIISVGMASEEEISEAVNTLKENGCSEIALLHCISSYPTKTEDLNLSKIKNLKEKYPECIVGFSDHSLDTDAPAMAVGLGAKIIERHICLDRNLGGPDSSFSSEPAEFKEFIDKVRKIEKSGKNFEELKDIFPNLKKVYGKPKYGPTNDFEKSGISARPSIWVNENIKKGETISEKNIKVVRPGNGLKPKHYENLIGKKIKRDVFKGEPFSWDIVE